jgi:hypothetical protein
MHESPQGHVPAHMTQHPVDPSLQAVCGAVKKPTTIAKAATDTAVSSTRAAGLDQNRARPARGTRPFYRDFPLAPPPWITVAA